MGLFNARQEPDSVRLGRKHDVTAEIHYSSGTDRWWYHGQLWLAESRPISEGRINPTLNDPRNREIIAALRVKGTTLEQAAAKCNLPLWVVRDVSRALETAGQQHQLRIYGLESARKEEERILTTIDQDLIHEAPMVPYTRTEKGAKRLQWAMTAAMIIVDAIFIFAMLQLVSQGPALEYDTAAITGTAIQFGEIISFPTAMLAVYVLMARRTLVLDMELQPIIEGLNDTHAEAVYLVNSEKSPAVSYVARIFRLDPAPIRELTEEIGRFQSDAIAGLQQQELTLRDELDAATLRQIDGQNRQLDALAFGRGQVGGVGAGLGVGTWLLILAIVAVVAGVAAYAVASGGV